MQSQILKLNPAELRLKLEDLGCKITSESTLKSLPQSVHWHIKSQDCPRGTLEATWLITGEAWLSYHSNRFQPWIKDILTQIA